MMTKKTEMYECVVCGKLMKPRYEYIDSDKKYLCKVRNHKKCGVGLAQKVKKSIILSGAEQVSIIIKDTHGTWEAYFKSLIDKAGNISIKNFKNSDYFHLEDIKLALDLIRKEAKLGVEFVYNKEKDEIFYHEVIK